MSYILDALRRAEAERERGKLPGLHTPLPGAPTEGLRPAVPAWIWAAAGLTLVGLAAAAWWLGASSTAANASAAAAAVPPPAAAPADLPPAIGVASRPLASATAQTRIV